MTAAETGVSRRLVALFAVACGAAVANLYYGQPLLAAIAGDLHVGAGTAALLVTASQIGYAAGLLAVLRSATCSSAAGSCRGCWS